MDTSCSAYRHNGDHELLAELGLKTYGFLREWTNLGTVTLLDEGGHGLPPTIQVEVAAYPAQFWRFTIARPHWEGRLEDGRIVDDAYVTQRFVMETGSGGFTDYWPVAKKVAHNMIIVKQVS